ncbi:MAG: hypothetical protein ACRCYY_16725 [Trueperaceae bacterium]
MKHVLVSLLLILGVAQAQLEVESVNFLRNFSGFLQGICPYTDDLQNFGNVLGLEGVDDKILSWMCATIPSVDRAANLAEGFLNDVNGFVNQTMGDSFGKLGEALGWQVGDTNLQALFDDALGNLQDGVFSAKGVAGQVISQINQAMYADNDLAPANATEAEQRIADTLERTPSHTMQQMQGVAVREDNILRSAEAVDVVNQAKTLAATSAARGDEQQLLLRVTNPAHAAGGQGGTADEAEDLGFAAVSSRAALQASVTAQADYMRQAAVSTGNMTQALKEQAMQQTLTTQQMGILVDSISEQNMREYEQWEEEYYDDVVKATAKARQVEENYGALAGLMSDNPPPDNAPPAVQP